jgi:Haem-degrading
MQDAARSRLFLGAFVTLPFAPRQCAMVILPRDRRHPRRRKSIMALILEEANRIIEGALAKAKELNIRISAAVWDAGGRLVAFQRMNNAIWASARQSGEGRRIGRLRPSERRAVRAGNPADPSRYRRRRGRPHDHGAGGRPDGSVSDRAIWVG